jgi:hypothetical protein
MIRIKKNTIRMMWMRILTRDPEKPTNSSSLVTLAGRRDMSRLKVPTPSRTPPSKCSLYASLLISLNHTETESKNFWISVSQCYLFEFLFHIYIDVDTEHILHIIQCSGSAWICFNLFFPGSRSA